MSCQANLSTLHFSQDENMCNFSVVRIVSIKQAIWLRTKMSCHFGVFSLVNIESVNWTLTEITRYTLLFETPIGISLTSGVLKTEEC